MSGKITDVFRQQKPNFERTNSSSKDQKEQQGHHGVSAVTNTYATDISEEEHTLRQFDLDVRFGPCTGMTRLERWNRAEKFGLNPPQHVKQLLDTLEGEQWNMNVWDGRI